MTRKSYIVFLLLLSPLCLTSFLCPSDEVKPEEDDCTKGRVTSHIEAGGITLKDDRNDHFQSTDIADVTCHGKFFVQVCVADPVLALNTTEPPIDVSFGTDFILGTDFPMTVRQEVDYRADKPDEVLRVNFIYEADMGAKNLNQEKDWKYVTYIRNREPSIPIWVRYSTIDFKPKKK